MVTKICTWEAKVGQEGCLGVDKKLDEKDKVCCLLTSMESV